MPPVNTVLKRFVGLFIPYSLVLAYQGREQRRRAAAAASARQARLERARASTVEGRRAFDYEAAIEVLATMGCDHWQLSEGSISERSLELCASTILKHFSGRGVVGLHVGNFVGVSLAYVTAAVVGANASSVVFSIDPNIPHRGIHNPADKVLRLLGHFGLQKNSVVLTGYSLEKSISNDGKAYTSDYDPAANFATEVSCEDQITWLGRIAPRRFDFAMMDGNHEGSYLRREIKALDDLLAPGGLLILDDLNWSEVSEVFMSAIGGGYRQVAGDGRVGILQKPPAS